MPRYGVAAIFTKDILTTEAGLQQFALQMEQVINSIIVTRTSNHPSASVQDTQIIVETKSDEHENVVVCFTMLVHDGSPQLPARL